MNLKLDWSAIVAEITADLGKAPQIIASIQGALQLLKTDAASVVPFLQKYFPKLASLEPAVAQEMDDVLNFLSLVAQKLPSVLPVILEGLTILSKFIPVAGA